ncbi:hypothetical protein [Pareuzebyella sediminis]|uniref:hypothetical protein n=1 Tax=Pareuzebyella sediminis TaxID=2607998 RepID=UPI0011EBAB7D|nr:hypothetical protein [Pareuzebyella sediminis]
MKKKEICSYCGDEYLPTRRGAQKFCSNSCRSLNWRKKKGIGQLIKDVPGPKSEVPQNNKIPNPPERMSLAGVGNAATGVAVAEVAKRLLTAEENRPATKKDIQELKALLKSRYLLIRNLKRDNMGRNPYYDVLTGNLVYL